MARLPTAAQPASGSKGLSRASGNLGPTVVGHPCRHAQHPVPSKPCQDVVLVFLVTDNKIFFSLACGGLAVGCGHETRAMAGSLEGFGGETCPVSLPFAGGGPAVCVWRRGAGEVPDVHADAREFQRLPGSVLLRHVESLPPPAGGFADAVGWDFG